MPLLGELDVEKYKCISKNIVTDEVIITNERIEHICSRRGQEFYTRYKDELINILQDPDYIFYDKENTALVCKFYESENKYINIALKLVVSENNLNYKNSILTVIGENKKRFQQRLRNNPFLYKKP